MTITNEDILNWLRRLAQVLHENRDYLTQLDSAIGDADHGINMDRGFKAVQEKIAGPVTSDIGATLKLVGTTLVSTVGGASGPLYGTAFLRAGLAAAGRSELSESDLVALLQAFLEGIKVRGKAQPGEKTMVDALNPAVEAAQAAVANQQDILEVTQHASLAAQAGMKATIPLQATKGRASYLGERSIGHQDPGATSCWLVIKTLADVLEEKKS
ncbi:MAG TPA: dihydroxyacetone kinase subunit DhaL [Chloroflexia bacterium]|nr:dihydroxyacetone kinase subunit DhaL [Chloroflexia bacterium]